MWRSSIPNAPFALLHRIFRSFHLSVRSHWKRCPTSAGCSNLSESPKVCTVVATAAALKPSADLVAAGMAAQGTMFPISLKLSILQEFSIARPIHERKKNTIGMHIRTFRILKQSSFVCNESCSFCGPVISSALLLKISLLSLFEAICYEMPNCGFLEIPLYQHSLDSSKVWFGHLGALLKEWAHFWKCVKIQALQTGFS